MLKHYFRPENGENVVIRYQDCENETDKIEWIARGKGVEEPASKGTFAYIIYWEISFRQSFENGLSKVEYTIYNEKDVNYDEFLSYLKDNYPEDLKWILFHPEILSGKFYNNDDKD